MKIMVLGHKDHGKTTVAEMLQSKFGFRFTDTTEQLMQIARHYVQNTPSCGLNWVTFAEHYNKNKDLVRPLMKTALQQYTKNDPARFIKEQYEKCDVYAGCRSSTEYKAAKGVIDFTFWVQDPRKEENDPTMDIVFDPDTMIHINNNGSLLQLECNLKHTLYQLAGIPVHSHDITLRDAIVSNMKHTQTGAHI